jgi:hypothetical protein
MDRANKRDRMKEYNRIRAEKKKNMKWKRKDLNLGPGRPVKWQKTIESDEEEVYFENLVVKDSDDPNSILTEVTPWVLSSYAEEGLEGMKEGFFIHEKPEYDNKIALKGEWRVVKDSLSSWVEYLRERGLEESELEIINLLKELKGRKRTEKQKCFRIVKDYSSMKNPEEWTKTFPAWEKQQYKVLTDLSGVYNGFFTYNKDKIEEKIHIHVTSYDLFKAEVFGYGENNDFGYFMIQGMMDIEPIEDFDNMIYFELFNPNIDEDEKELPVEDEANLEEIEMREMEKDLKKIRVWSLKLGKFRCEKQYIKKLDLATLKQKNQKKLKKQIIELDFDEQQMQEE